MHEHKSLRFVSLDVFRGITVVLMIIVNSPGNHTSFAVLQHSSWNGCTLADLVFPFFLWVVGVSSVLAFSNQKAQGFFSSFLIHKILKRTIFLFVIGLLLNAISLHVDWPTIRILGVLQRIAICYFVAAWLYLTTSIRTQALLIVILLVGYWFLIILGSENFIFYMDRLILTPPHLYNATFDPEGLLSTLPAIATTLLGSLTGAFLLSHYPKLKGMILGGLVMIVIGGLWSFVFPINKTLWTSSYVLWTAGWALLTFSFCYWMIEIKQWKKWVKPLELFGLNALAAYILHVLFLKIQAMITIAVSENVTINLKFFITQTLFFSFEPRWASLLYACSYAFLWFLAIFSFSTLKKSNTSHD